MLSRPFLWMLCPFPGLACPAGGWIDIEWRQNGGVIEYSCRADAKLIVRFPDGTIREIAARNRTTWSLQPLHRAVAQGLHDSARAGRENYQANNSERAATSASNQP